MRSSWHGAGHRQRTEKSVYPRARKVAVVKTAAFFVYPLASHTRTVIYYEPSTTNKDKDNERHKL